MRSFQLYLSTLITSPASNNIVPIDVTNKGQCTWNVDFKSLFGNYYGKYKRCSVRTQMQSASWVAADTDENSYDGYLSLNLPSTYSASTSAGTPIALLNPSLAPYASTPQSFYNVSTLGNVHGTDINMPGENQFITIRFLTNDSFGTMIGVPNYQIMLQFELSEPIE
jgi:hypothetical protein